jgi:hypothetical protein
VKEFKYYNYELADDKRKLLIEKVESYHIGWMMGLLDRGLTNSMVFKQSIQLYYLVGHGAIKINSPKNYYVSAFNKISTIKPIDISITARGLWLIWTFEHFKFSLKQ